MHDEKQRVIQGELREGKRKALENAFQAQIELYAESGMLPEKGTEEESRLENIELEMEIPSEDTTFYDTEDEEEKEEEKEQVNSVKESKEVGAL